MTKLFCKDLQTTSCHAMRAGGVVFGGAQAQRQLLASEGHNFCKMGGCIWKKLVLQAKQMKIKRRTPKGFARLVFLGKTL